MALIVPRLDDLGYDDLLQEAIARIPVHTPEWTNHNESDPGITLLELFAFITENLLYRSNLIPERNRLKFLQLLGVSLRPASAATGVAVLTNERGPLETVTLPPRIPVLAGAVPFVSTSGLDVLPVEMRAYYRRKLTDAELKAAQGTYDQLYGSWTDATTSLDFYQTTAFEAPIAGAAPTPLDLGDDTTVDHSLWLAILARPGDAARPDDVKQAIAGRTLTLGLMPAAERVGRVLPAGAPASARPVAMVQYQLATGQPSGGTPQYLTLPPESSDDPFRELALVQLTLPAVGSIGTWSALEPLEEGVGDYPPSVDDPDVRARLLTWIRVRSPEATGAVPALRLLWVGINAARVSQRVDVPAELLGAGTGEPDQRFTLVNTPVLPDTVTVAVGGEIWRRTDDLMAEPPEVAPVDPLAPPAAGQPGADARVFEVDGASGEVRFGDGLHGKRPPAGAAILASYSYGGGRAGNVGVGAIKTSPLLPAGFKVANPLPTWGGAEGESVLQAEKSIPRVLRHRDRAVSVDDFRDILSQTPGVDLARSEVLPLYHPDRGAPAPGVVSVMVVPADPAHAEGPVPSDTFLRAVCAHLDPRRLITTEVHVVGPEYVGIWVSVGIDVIPGATVSQVRDSVRAALQAFLSPTVGGLQHAGWPLATAVEDRELLVQAARVDGVSKVRQVLVWPSDGSTTTAQPTIDLQGLQLPRLDRIVVSLGDPLDLPATDAAAGEAPTVGGKPVRRLPVPVLPPEC